MTTSPSTTRPPATLVEATDAPTWRPRTELDLAAQQLQAISRFNDARRAAEQAAAAVARSRERRRDVSRSLEVLRREHEAVVARAHEQLRLTGDLLRATAQRRVVLAHRNEWFAGKLTCALQDHRVEVIARVDNGADAVGIAVAEQPDLLLVEDTLAMVPGEQVVRDVRTYCPSAVVAAQVAYGDRIGALLEAGASPVFTRRIPPADVASELIAALSA